LGNKGKDTLKRCVAVVAVQNPIGEKVKTEIYIYIFKYINIIVFLRIGSPKKQLQQLQRCNAYLSKRLIYNNINHQESIIH
jgi:hypothetical protein